MKILGGDQVLASQTYQRRINVPLPERDRERIDESDQRG